MASAPDIPIDIIQDVPAQDASCPFEGPEKLLEIWFAPGPFAPSDDGEEDGHRKDQRDGLRKVKREVWEAMLDIVQCKVLSVIHGIDMDAYLLSESSFFVFPHKLILKTCGTTLNLLGLPRILAIAREQCNFKSVWRCFYSRKSFMFPERQPGPHREWSNEVEYLDALFSNGAAYTVGKVNGDHWLLYITSPPEEEEDAPGITVHNVRRDLASSVSSLSSTATLPSILSDQDYTIELLMTKLAAPARRPFFFLDGQDKDKPSHEKAAAVSARLGIDSIFPTAQTHLDSYAFEPCGYSANALVEYGQGEGYYTIHVTPEEGWSYASFECNVPIKPSQDFFHHIEAVEEEGGEEIARLKEAQRLPDLEMLIQRVVKIFQPGHISLTLFVSSAEQGDEEDTTPIESAQRVFRRALAPFGYKRTDKINYEFGGYDLAFATFQKR